jgi:hypothetical protein
LRRSKIVGASDVKLTTSSGSVVWKQGAEIAVRASLTGKRHVKIDRAPVIFLGYGVTAPERPRCLTSMSGIRAGSILFWRH